MTQANEQWEAVTNRVTDQSSLVATVRCIPYCQVFLQKQKTKRNACTH